ncbi:MAG: hypothetical protein K8T26_18100 [Lentisphaerae bacterium]|nr:hypothetical protein [Lentisphaerota bacterium]
MRAECVRVLQVVLVAGLAMVGGIVPVEALDFGDAPDPGYPTLLASDGARHTPGGPWLGNAGNAPDDEIDGQQNANALGDDFNDSDDEDGVSFPPLIRGRSASIGFEVSGTTGVVEIWIDLNADGTWQHPQEIVHLGTYAMGSHAFAYTLPVGTQDASTFARCRISTAGTGSPSGEAADGEVEDHNVFLNDGVADWCNLQFPPDQRVRVGVPTGFIYGQVWINGETSKGGATPGLAAQLGYGPDGSDPATSPDWVWVNATYNLDVGNNDEYMATLTAAHPGVYDYAYRYSWFGGAYAYGDLDGMANGYDPAQAGHLVVLPEPECPKWVQPPDCDVGLDVRSYRDLAAATNRVADDFVSDGRPITAVRWWGSYIGYGGLPDLTLSPPGLRPVAFELSWYTDRPAGTLAAWSMPGTLVTNVEVTLLPYGVASNGATGVVSETFFCTTDLSWARPVPPVPPFEHEYEYRVLLPEPWLELHGGVYWLSVRALYAESALFPWGWKTTPVLYNWNDHAVSATPASWTNIVYPPPGWTSITNHPYRGQPVNLAFEMLTDVCPRRCLKWQQGPDLVAGTDLPSWRRADGPDLPGQLLRADDFVSDGRRITDLHWWGSYPGWQTEQPGQPAVAPVPPPAGPLRPLGFDISWHADAGSGCIPGAVITNLFVPMALCHEVYFGQVDQSPWWGRPYFEHEYQYDVDLLNDSVSGLPWPELAGARYWLNIQAVFPAGFLTNELHQGWGWKSTPMTNLCPSAVSPDGGQAWQHDGLPPPHPMAGQPFDLAFELTTIDQPDSQSPWFDEVFITNIAVQAGTSNVYTITSLGDCGCGLQTLQSSTNLRAAGLGFTDVWTNRVPLTRNLWQVTSTNTRAFYRVLQRD